MTLTLTLTTLRNKVQYMVEHLILNEVLVNFVRRPVQSLTVYIILLCGNLYALEFA
jgi:hypothetical protein